MATNETASFCVAHRLCQDAIFVFAKVGKGRLSSYVKRDKKIYIFFTVVVYYFIIYKKKKLSKVGKGQLSPYVEIF